MSLNSLSLPCAGGERRHPDPTPLEIEFRAAEIRPEWSKAELQKRLAVSNPHVELTPLKMRLPGRKGGTR